MITKLLRLSAVLMMAGLLVPALASAHVVVRPAQVSVGAFQTFTVGVPNEKDMEVTQVKLTVPANLNYVTPTVKPGWHIQTDKTSEGEAAKLTAITWSGGTIPSGQRDDFSFSAQIPAEAADITWKAYQTYADGTTVAWDQKPAGDHEAESETSGPYSVTKVVNDLAAAAAPTATKSGESNYLALAVATLALIIGVAAILRSSKNF